jgi:uncharacterized membrane protein HdeD (DUF308 family)
MSVFRIGAVFAALGVAAIVWPVVATLAVEVFIAWLLVVWGVVGCAAALSLAAPGFRSYGAIAYGSVVALGLLLAVFPGAGAATLTLILAAAFLIEGLMTILFAISLRERLKSWGWLVFSGLCALILGGLVLSGWPGSAAWTLGVLTGVNFLSTGIALVMMSRRRGQA